MLFGHQDKIELFKKLVEADSLSHAYLFYGPSGIGKFLFVREFASLLEGGKEPLIDSKVFLRDEKGKIGVEAAREIKSFLSGKPFRSPRRLAVLRDAETLTDEAQSALLKIVEEPPSRSLIIFIAADPQVLFAPLRSRLNSVYFRSFSKSEIKKFLTERRKISVSYAEEIASKSFGRIRRAVNLLEGEEKDESLAAALEEKIISLYLKGGLRNSKVLEKLLEREAVLLRYNLNQNLQQKAIEYLLR